mmetsp:Transcript_114159/g.179721  ORF Transcript_114159/g.179721 Transcript_114159/m.179721 type:complete len:351 (-) Transcript_114159:126-1178(-)
MQALAVMLHRALVLWACLVSVSSRSSAGYSEEKFESQCQSDNDFGWPRFHSLSELQTSPWSSYFVDVYGGLPNKFPVCIYDFWGLDKDAYVKANITGHKLVSVTEVQEGDLFELSSSSLFIYHGTYKPLPDNTWVEIAHTAFPTELSGFWVWRQRGSGIWYNIGKTKVFPTPADPSQTHKEAIAFLTQNCSKTPSWQWPQQESDIFGFCAREKGYDSIQFEPQAGQKKLGTFGLTGQIEMVLVNVDGKYNCGVEDASHTPLRAGWMASETCSCENYEFSDTCGLMARAPFPMSILGTSPPLCEAQSGHFWNRWKACNPATCKQTACKFKKDNIATIENVAKTLPEDVVLL